MKLTMDGVKHQFHPIYSPPNDLAVDQGSFMKRLITFLTLAVATLNAAVAGQYCVIDPPRPASGAGFYVAKPSTQLSVQSTDDSYKLYDPAGNEFRIRGLNRNHWDSGGSKEGVPLTGANTERLVLNFANSTTYNWNIVQTEMLDKGIVPMPSSWVGTCKTDPSYLTAIVDTWIAQASTWTRLNTLGLINIANEWGPGTVMAVTDPVTKRVSNVPTYVWRDSNIGAISRMRAGGYTGTLVIDAGNCGQDAGTIVRDGQAVFDSDPLKNILFSVHIYGSWHVPIPATATTAAIPLQPWMQSYSKAMYDLKATKLPIMIGEFGPLKTGPSQTQVPAEQLVADAEAAGWGWMPWSWDDNNGAACSSTDVGGFAMSNKCGRYTGNDATELTAWGRLMVPMYRKYGAKRVTIQLSPLAPSN